MRVTAKAQVSGRQPSAAEKDGVRITLGPDYQDGRNAEWALATPALNINMTVKGDVADFFEQGGKYTVIFERTED